MDTRKSGVSSSVLLTENGHVEFSLAPERGSPKKPQYLTHLTFENKLNTARSRFLRSFALPEHTAQLRLS